MDRGRTALRYALFQLPGLALVAALLYLATTYEWISPRTAWAAFFLWLAKDIALYPILRRAYRPDPKGPEDALVGRIVVAEDALDPEGRVKLGSESWRARITPSDRVIAAASRARIVGMEGLCLIVESIESDGVDPVDDVDGVARSGEDPEIESPSSGRIR